MSIPRTERIIPHARTKEERVAITLEYLSSFVIWCERLDDIELQLLGSQIQNLIHPRNEDGLKCFLENCVDYLSNESEE